MDTQTKKKTILVVEDETPLRNVLRDKFTDEGFLVLEAKDGKEGLEIALTKRPDLILLDIIMPVSDGMTMLFALRRDSWGSEVPVILLTNLLDADKLNRSLDSGVSEYLVKSDWKLEDIVKKVKTMLAI